MLMMALQIGVAMTEAEVREAEVKEAKVMEAEITEAEVREVFPMKAVALFLLRVSKSP